MNRRDRTLTPEGNQEGDVREQVDRHLRDTGDIYRVLFKSSFFAVYLHDFDGNFLDANDAALELLGYERGAADSLRIDSLLSVDDLQRARATLDEIRRTGRQREITRYKLKKRNGDFVWVDTEGFLLYRAGKPYAIQGIAQDVTERVRAQEEVTRYQEHLEDLVEERTASLSKANEELQREIAERCKIQETLAESEERYRRLAENIQDMIWIADAEGKLIYINRAVEQIVGISAKDAVGMPMDQYLTKDSLRKTESWILEAERAQRRRDFYHGEVEVLHRDGHPIPCEANVTILRDNEGRILRYEGVTRDISRRKRAEEAMRRLNVELERKVKERTEELERAYSELKRLDRTKDEFLSLVSHELRTPLTSIRSFSEILLTYEDDPETRKEFLTIIKTESERLTRLINNLLDFSKIEAGAVTWHDDLFPPEQIIRDAARALQHQIREKHLRLILDIPPDLPLVFSDRDRIQQVLTNLLSNAIKFSFEGGEIRLRAEGLQGKRFRETSTWIKVSVRDEGIGIDEKDFEIIFHRFRQVPTDTLGGKPGGTGLGLPICKEIISHYGGNIWVESRKGKGSTFCFTLPAAPSAHSG